MDALMTGTGACRSMVRRRQHMVLDAAATACQPSGIDHVAVGMHRQGFDLQLTQYDDRGWRANRCRHQARQRAAWQVLIVWR